MILLERKSILLHSTTIRDPNTSIPYTVVGVVKDFHFESLKENIRALGIRPGTSQGLISFRFKVDDVAQLIQLFEIQWQEFGSGQPFAYSFLDESL